MRQSWAVRGVQEGRGGRGEQAKAKLYVHLPFRSGQKVGYLFAAAPVQTKSTKALYIKMLKRKKKEYSGFWVLKHSRYEKKL